MNDCDRSKPYAGACALGRKHPCDRSKAVICSAKRWVSVGSLASAVTSHRQIARQHHTFEPFGLTTARYEGPLAA